MLVKGNTNQRERKFNRRVFWLAVFLLIGIAAARVVLAQLPGPAHSPSPFDGEEQVPLDTNLTWDSDEPPDRYRVDFGTDTINDWKIDICVTDLPICSNNDIKTNYGILQNGTIYQWQVHSEFGGTIYSSPVWQFTTELLAPPNTPTGLNHKPPPDQTTSQLIWVWNNVLDEDRYELQYSDGTSIDNNIPADTTEKKVTGLSANTQYSVQVRACRNGATPECSGWSASASAYTSIEAPTGVSFGTVTGTSIEARGSGSFSNLGSGSSGVQVEKTTSPVVTKTCANCNTNQLFDSLSCGNSYNFRARAKNGDGDWTGWSSPDDSQSTSACPLPDLVVIDVDISGNLCKGSSQTLKATVKNQDSGTAGASTTHLELDPLGGCDASTGSLISNDSETVSCNFTPNSSGTFDLTGIADWDAVVSESNENNNERTESFTITAAPSGTLSLGHTGNRVDEIDWSWSDTSNEDYYEVWVSNDNSTFRLLGTQNVTTFTLDQDVNSNPLNPNTLYWVRVVAVNSCGTVTDTAAAYTSIQNGTGATFSNVTDASLDVAPQGTFTNLSTGSSGVRVRLVTSSTSCGTAATPDPPYRQDKNAVTFSGLDPDTNYYACVRTRNGDAIDPPHATDVNDWTGPYGPQKTLASTPSTPTWASPNHTGNTPTSINWDWNDVTGETRYELRYAGGSTINNNISADTTEYNHQSLSADTQYSVQVRACHSNASPECSGWSSTASAYTSANTPAGCSGSAVSQTQINWSWTSGGSESNFRAQDTTSGNSCNNAVAGQECTGPTSWDEGGLSCGTSYELRVWALNGDGDDSPGYAQCSQPTIACNNPPNQPTNQSPSDGAYVATTQPTLSASAFSDPDSGDTHANSRD